MRHAISQQGKIGSQQGKIGPFPDHSTAFEVDTELLDGTGCACILCRPQGSLLSFMSRDNLDVTGGRPAHRFNRQRLNHQFTAIREAPVAWVAAPNVDRLQYKRGA